MKILSVGTNHLPTALRHFQKFYNERGAKIDLECVEISQVEDLDLDLREKSNCDVVRIDLHLSDPWIRKSPVHPLQVSRFHAADYFGKTPHGWEPDLLFERGLHDIIVRQAHHLDLRSSAYVVGQGPCLRVVGGVVLSLGFKRMWLVGESEDDLVEQKEVLDRLHSANEILPLNSQSLTLQTVGGSLLINTLSLNNRPELASDLAYFNFMNRGGVVMDLYSGAEEKPMLDEATRAGLRVLPPHEISAQTEVQMALKMGLGKLATTAEYVESWRKELLGEDKNPPSV